MMNFRNLFGGMLLLITSCHNNSQSNSKAAVDSLPATTVNKKITIDSLPFTFVDSAHSKKGYEWYYNTGKADIINSGGFYFKNAQELANNLRGFIKNNNKDNISGVNIYIGQTNEIVKNRDNIALIFVPTVKTAQGNDSDIVAKEYNILTPGSGLFAPVPFDIAKQYVRMYMKGKKKLLDATLTMNLSDRKEGETAILWASREHINDICSEIDYQIKNNNKVVGGMYVALTAHSNTDVLYPERLNILFYFSDKTGNPISIEDINPKEYSERAMLGKKEQPAFATTFAFSGNEHGNEKPVLSKQPGKERMSVASGANTLPLKPVPGPKSEPLSFLFQQL